MCKASVSEHMGVLAGRKGVGCLREYGCVKFA